MVDPGALDFLRDTLSAVVAGLVIMGLGTYFAHRRAVKKRLERHAVEIRHTQKETNVKPFYDGEL